MSYGDSEAELEDARIAEERIRAYVDSRSSKPRSEADLLRTMVGVEIQLSQQQRCKRRMSMAPWGYTAQCDLVDSHDGMCQFEGAKDPTV